jgi:hypothetical protein
MKKERGNFRPVYTSIWDDEDFKSFDSDTKVVFFNLRTSRFGNWPCIYVMYPENVAAQTGIPLKKVMGSLMTLSMRSWIAHVPPVVWIVKGLRNDPNWNSGNPKQVKGIEDQLRSLPKSPLVARFCKFYGLSFLWVSSDDPIDESIDNPIDTHPMERKPEAVSRKPEAVSRKPGDVSRKPGDVPAPEKQKFLDFVILTSEEHGKLVKKFGDEETAARIASLNHGIGSKGYKYKSHYHAILSWAMKDEKEGKKAIPNRPEPKGAAAVRLWAEKNGVTA